MFRPDFRVFVLPWKQTVSPTFTLLQKRSDVHSKVTFFFAGGKKKSMLLSYPDSAPPFSQATKNRLASSSWCPSWCQQFPRFRHLSRRMLTNLLPTLLVGSHPKKGNPQKLRRQNTLSFPSPPSFQVRFFCQNYFHLSFRAVMQFTCIEQPPTQGFQQNLLKLQISSGNSGAFWDVNQQKSRTNLEKQLLKINKHKS